ncbi:MAG: hypothetical protein E6K81_05800 [Candidatus Eisenbacteria bacterium]|uniref:Uncharacterized protein n=1 Tax=Eiseniibacteriota bacterium TaxID=2212470 RepID=A0A538UAU7_UNCEI|nr:MAG: hypothetical protein E6K81_05800 [Candidatus Eisenbacteria bacterium]
MSACAESTSTYESPWISAPLACHPQLVDEHEVAAELVRPHLGQEHVGERRRPLAVVGEPHRAAPLVGDHAERAAHVLVARSVRRGIVDVELAHHAQHVLDVAWIERPDPHGGQSSGNLLRQGFLSKAELHSRCGALRLPAACNFGLDASGVVSLA